MTLSSDAGKTSRVDLISLYLPAFILTLAAGLVVPALPILAKSFSVSFGVASLAMAVPLLGSASATIPTGYLLDHYSRRWVAVTGPLLTMISCLLVTTASSFTEVLIFQFLAGWGHQMWMLGRLTMLGDLVKKGQLGRQITGMVGMESAGRLVGPGIGGFIVAAWGPRVPFALQGVLCLMVVLTVLWVFRHSGSRPAPKATDAERVPVPGFLQMALKPPLSTLVVVQLLVAMTRGALFSGVIDLYMVYFYNIGPTTLGLLRSFTGGLALPITFMAGHIMDRFGRKATMVPGFLLLSGGFCLMAIVAAMALPFPYFMGAFIFVHMSTNLTSGSMQTLAIDLAPPESRGRFLGILRLGSECGSFASSAGFAFIATALGYSFAFVMLGIAAVTVATVVAKSVTETVRRK
jgi:MFS family permease